MKRFEELCKMTQVELKEYLTEYMEAKYGDVTVGDGYVYAKGTFPVMLVAHMDTVHKQLPTAIDNINGRISSPQGIGGDDRCGVFIIMNIVTCNNSNIGLFSFTSFVYEPNRHLNIIIIKMRVCYVHNFKFSVFEF